MNCATCQKNPTVYYIHICADDVALFVTLYISHWIIYVIYELIFERVRIVTAGDAQIRDDDDDDIL